MSAGKDAIDGAAGKLLLALVDSVDEAFHVAGADGIILTWNAASEQIYGYSAAEAIGRPLGVGCPPERRDELAEYIAQVKSGRRVTLETQRIRKDGRVIDVEIRATSVRDEHGELIAIGGAVRDITERRRSQARAADELYLLEQAQAVAKVGSWLAGIAMGDELVWSKETYRIFGVPEGTPINVQTFFDFVHPEDRNRVRQASEASQQRGALYEIEHRIVRPDGEVRAIYGRAITIRNDAGEPLRMIGICQDITDRRRIEEQLRQAQKMDAIGRLAGGVAHDFNNLLTIILTYLDALAKTFAPDDSRRADLDEVRKASEQAATLTRQLLAFSRRQVLQPRVVDLGEIARGMERMLTRVLGEDIRVSVVVPPALGRVKADPGQMEQVIVNLAVNARDAMPEGGTLTLELFDLDVGEAARQPGVGPGRYVVLAVADTGVGMDAATRARAFEPFFTTKDRGRGTGLGLATVFGVVEQSGGQIRVESEPGRGTTFRIYLPRTDEPLPPAPREVAPAPGKRSETILLVEDETQVRAVLKRALAAQGYEVLEAGDVEHAFELCGAFRGTIHLLLTDIVMPKLNGRELARQLLRIRPTMKVLYMSGYTGDAAVRDGLIEAGTAFLQKPITGAALSEAVRAVLEG
jgi:two-component system, cell cycle sensor histidine kinase and response regulator CckA